VLRDVRIVVEGEKITAAGKQPILDRHFSTVPDLTVYATIQLPENFGAKGVTRPAKSCPTTPCRVCDAVGVLLDNYYSSYRMPRRRRRKLCKAWSGQDLAGRVTPFAPKFSGSWMVAYTVKSGTVLKWRIENRLFASSRYFLAFNNDPNVAQHGYVREDLTVAIMGNAGWEILVSGQNLGNQTIRTYGAPQPVTLELMRS